MYVCGSYVNARSDMVRLEEIVNDHARRVALRGAWASGVLVVAWVLQEVPQGFPQ